MTPDEIEAWRQAFPQCEFLDGTIRTKPDEIDVRKLMSEQNERIQELEDYSTALRKENERLAGALEQSAKVFDALANVDDLGPFASMKAMRDHAKAARRALSGEPTP
jgi:hypothetical protein